MNKKLTMLAALTMILAALAACAGPVTASEAGETEDHEWRGDGPRPPLWAIVIVTPAPEERVDAVPAAPLRATVRVIERDRE